MDGRTEKRMWKTQMGRFRILAFCEGLSFLGILFLTMPLKYIYGMPKPNQIIGLVHGFLFLFYLVQLAQIQANFAWDGKKTFWVFLASVFPFGTFIADHKIFRFEPKEPRT